MELIIHLSPLRSLGGKKKRQLSELPLFLKFILWYYFVGEVKKLDVLSSKKINLLLQRIALGDRVALNELYVAMKMPIFLYVKTIVKKQEASEDITQQVFLEIMGSVYNYKHSTNAKAWIFTIAKNLCFDYIKKERREIATDDKNLEYYISHIEGLDKKTLVYEALNRLKDIERQIVVLYIYAGFTQKEISKLLDIPYIKIRSMYGYAIRKLKVFYGGECDENQAIG